MVENETNSQKQRDPPIFQGRETMRSGGGNLKGELSLDVTEWNFNDKTGLTARIGIVTIPTRDKKGSNIFGNFDPTNPNIRKLFSEMFKKVDEHQKTKPK